MGSATLALLTESYEHYQKTGNKRFFISPKNPDYLFSAITSVEELRKSGYIDNLSKELLNKIPPRNKVTILIAPLEDLSFDITFKGIEFVEKSNR